jgi:YfiH family protein
VREAPFPRLATTARPLTLRREMAFERRTFGKAGHVLVDTALESDGFLAAFSERTGGVSEKPYDSLNLSFGVGDDDESVLANRRSLVDWLDMPQFAVAQQSHGAKAVRVGAKRAGAGFLDDADRVPGADALYTKSHRVPLGVLAADCLPIVMASGREGVLAVVHAGWRGLAEGLLGASAGLFQDRAAVHVSIGPAIGPCHYEVGEDVALAVSAGTEAGAVTKRGNGKMALDLVATARAELKAHGIRRVEDTGLCTACEQARFFSHRRDDVITGRQAGIGMRLP